VATYPSRVAELTRTVTVRKTGKTATEVVYLITPLTREEASPERLIELVRGHWGIENSSHYVRDVTDCGKIVLASALATLHKSWPRSAISLLLLFTVKGLLRLLPLVAILLLMRVQPLPYYFLRGPPSNNSQALHEWVGVR
jgi:hypothetical protein